MMWIYALELNWIWTTNKQAIIFFDVQDVIVMCTELLCAESPQSNNAKYSNFFYPMFIVFEIKIFEKKKQLFCAIELFWVFTESVF